ncbi:uncharacterized protein LOC141904625 isoform X2 [Tubulanus polymorphus]|uniref:uncharacterized protein LOC141904625 isoform X2 n=1 Tax=Tubulanus polymorphus TaxID=672921 RepID=UPI003DA46B94
MMKSVIAFLFVAVFAVAFANEMEQRLLSKCNKGCTMQAESVPENVKEMMLAMCDKTCKFTASCMANCTKGPASEAGACMQKCQNDARRIAMGQQ